MLGNSRAVVSSQLQPLEKLSRLVQKHQVTTWQKPTAPHSLHVWNELGRWRQPHLPLILDLGCGRGLSCRQLHQAHPQAQVLGIDKSSVRLRDAPPPSPHLCLTRGELEDLIPLMVASGWKASQVFVLYPNPWPKPTQAKRRWPYHPLFPLLVQLGPVELRTNWLIYAQEWHQACQVLGLKASPPKAFQEFQFPTTHFEQKYLTSGQTLWKVVCGE
jgi:tRNA (guanine-N7-)-methyltransferase